MSRSSRSRRSRSSWFSRSSSLMPSPSPSPSPSPDGLQRRVALPPVDAHLARLVDGGDEQPQLDRQQLDVEQVDLDVARDDDALVEHPLEDVGEARLRLRAAREPAAPRRPSGAELIAHSAVRRPRSSGARACSRAARRGRRAGRRRSPSRRSCSGSRSSSQTSTVTSQVSPSHCRPLTASGSIARQLLDRRLGRERRELAGRELARHPIGHRPRSLARRALQQPLEQRVLGGSPRRPRRSRRPGARRVDLAQLRLDRALVVVLAPRPAPGCARRPRPCRAPARAAA